MIGAIGLKRFAIGVTAAAIAAVAGVLVGFPYFVSADAVRDAVKNEIRTVTGLDLVLRGDASVSLFPSSVVSFAHVVLGDERGQPALASERLTAQVRLLPLFLGRIEIADVSLVRPQITVSIGPGGASNWSGLLAMLSQTLKPNRTAAQVVSFSEVRIAEGTVLIRDEARGIAETLTGVDLSLAWPSISKSFGATGRFVWRDELVNASLSLGDLFAALSGERSGLKLRLASRTLNLAFDGHMSDRPTLKVDGVVAADSTRFREAVRWIWQIPIPDSGFDRFALKAQTSAVGGTVALSSVNLEMDGNAAEGVLTVTASERPVVQGTLAADSIDLTPYVSAIRVLAHNERDWNRVPIVLDGLSGLDLDLRLSAAQVAVSGAKLGRAALVASLRGGRLTLTVGESQAFGGVLKGSASIAKAGAGADVKAQLQFTGVDLERCLSELFGTRRIEGKGDLALAIEGSGDSVLSLTRTLNGSVALAAREGTLVGINVEQLLRRLERRPLSGGGEFRSGRTPFERLNIGIKIVNGAAIAEDVRLEGAGVRLALGGSASIPTRDLDLKGTASLVQAAADGSSPFELPFIVQGRWDDPIMLPDPQILIRRSGAAAPLLDAVRDRKTREAVRSAIEQLTRGAAAVPATVPPAPASAAASAAPPQ